MATENNSAWLDQEIKQIYIKANFNSLLQYLSDYTNEGTDCDNYIRTVEVIKAEVYDYIKEVFSGCIYRNVVNQWDDAELEYVTRLFCAYLLTINKIDGKSDNIVLATLCNILALSGKVFNVSILFPVLASCMQNKSVINYSFGWNIISTQEISFYNKISQELPRTKFNDNSRNNKFEGKGLLLANRDNICFANMNFSEYKQHDEQKELGILFTERNFFNIVTTRDKELSLTDASDILKIADACDEFKSVMSHVMFSGNGKNGKKNYENGDRLTVRVTETLQGTILAESIDQGYNQVKGRIALPNKVMRYYTKETLESCIHIGDAIEVVYTNDSIYCFLIDETLTEYYKSWAEDSIDMEFKAVRIATFSMGYVWVTEEGLYVNILDNNPEIEGNYRDIRIKGLKFDRTGNFVICAEYASKDFGSENNVETFNDDAQRFFLRQFIRTTNTPKQIQEDKIENIDKRVIKAIINLAYCTSKILAQPLIDRYRDVAFAMFLAMLVGDILDEKYFTFVIKFFKSITAFARGIGLENYKLEADKDIADIPDVKNMLAIYNKLYEYKDDEMTPDSIIDDMRKVSYLEYSNNKVSELVRLSNNLNGNLTRPEINRIKKAIVTQLGADEEYRSITNEETYYGEESDTLEFITSIVSLPQKGKMRDLDNQMETVKKTVCAFLNSTNGGELLIGVNDAGYYRSLEGDIVNLYNTKKITEKSMEKLRLFVKDALDQAFEDVDGTVSGLEITADHVTCNICRNKENNEILRINVAPYEFGIVELQKMENDTYGTHSFLRISGETVPMSKDMREKVIKRKFSMQNLNKVQKLKLALARKLQVILKDYTSSTRTTDRYVEVYKIHHDINAVICYDIEMQKVVEYKIPRMQNVEILYNKPWEYESEHENRTIDAFHMLSTNEKPIHVKLLLNAYAKDILCEEYPKTKTDIKEVGDDAWIYDSYVNNVSGIGRFYLGMAKQIEILEGQELSMYVTQYARNFILR